MSQHKKSAGRQKSYIVVYFAVALVVIIIGLSAAVFAVVRSQNSGNTTQKSESSVTQSTTQAVQNDVVIKMAGDVLLHQTTAGDTVSGAAKATGNYDFHKYFSAIQDYMECDLGLCDIEGTVNVNGDDKDLSYYPYFNLPQEILPALKDLGFTTIVTANNHIWDYGASGAYATVKNIKAAGLDEIGTYESAEANQNPHIVEVNGIKIGILAWTDSTNGNYMDDEHIAYITKRFDSGDIASADKIQKDVDALKNAGAEFIIACIHWGVEYQDQPSDVQKQIAHKLIDGGVDFLMGNHPHCLQPMEKVSTTRNGVKTNRYIAYALGNFIGDQIVLAKDGLKTQQSAIVTITLHRNASGKVEISSGEYLPVLTHAYYKNGQKDDYKVLPMTALKDNPISCQYANSTYFSDSYKRVTNLLGNALPVSEYGAGMTMPDNN